MKTNRKQLPRRLGCAFLAFVMVLGTVLTVPFVFELPISAAADETFTSGAVLIDSSYNGKNILIQNGVFSVTVVGATGVSIIFENVKMDLRRSYGASSETVTGLCKVSEKLVWGNVAQMCPLLITGNSDVTVAFRGDNTFYGGTNKCTVSNDDTLTVAYDTNDYGAGFAGVQVDSGSKLTIAASGGVLNAYGGYYVEDDNSNNIPNSTLYKSDSEGYGEPAGCQHNVTGGGAGIGGGATYNTTTSKDSSYTSGTPGTIVINGGIINAFGGHQAAGIGGGLNGAATTSSITINGGTVTAKGGRWAAGIGDGDSLMASYTTLYGEKYSINITGGTVKATGGVGCPGIGTTDTISANYSNTITSGLSIHLASGTVTAHSGYPDGFNPTTGKFRTSNLETAAGKSAAAAIGAGNHTKMEAHSIYIVAGTKIVASGFGHYAVTENGIDFETAPQVTMESGRIYNGRFPDLVSNEDRKFILYEEQRVDVAVDGIKREFIIFTSQTTDGTEGKLFYYNSDEMILLDENKQQIDLGETHDEKKTALSKWFSDNHLTVYVDDNSEEIDEVTALKFFKSISLTLPDPKDHGGIYALRIPTDSVTMETGVVLPKFVVVTITAADDKNIWSEITYPCESNSKMDALSEAFERVDIYPDETTDESKNGLIGKDKYNKTIFTYKVYIEPTATAFYLYASFLTADDVTSTVQITRDGEFVTVDQQSGDGYAYISEDIEMPQTESSKTVLLMKTDTGGVAGITAHAVIYRIEIIRKATYTIKLPDLSKIYDGRVVNPSVALTDVVDGTNEAVEAVTQEDLDKIKFTYQRVTDDSTEDCSAPKNAGTYQVTATIEAESYTATSAVMHFTISKKTLTVSRIENYLTYVTKAKLEEWKANETNQYPLENSTGLVVLNGVVSGDQVSVTVGGAYYNDLTVGYGPQKITLENVTLSGNSEDEQNYTIEPTQKVFGQISYNLTGAIFRKADGDSAWDKFYPTDSKTPVTDGSADYHSPKNDDGYTSHVEYVYARTQGKGERGAVYAMELEFGSMQFVYTEKVWNPDTMEYEEAENGNSFWLGFNGENNCVTVINRSNKAVGCTVTAYIDFIHGMHGNSGIGVGVYDSNLETNTTNISGVAQAVPAATAGNSKEPGEVGTKQFFIRLTGVPALVDGGDFTSVGNLTVKFSTT